MGWRAAPSFSLIDCDDFGGIPFHFSRQHMWSVHMHLAEGLAYTVGTLKSYIPCFVSVAFCFSFLIHSISFKYLFVESGRKYSFE